MSQQTLTTREFLNAVGISTNSGGDLEGGVPVKHRHLLIASVLECIPAQKLRKLLESAGLKVTTRDVLEWQRETREWLGLPPASPGKPSAQYLRAIQEWRETNGNPSWEEIDSGWIPAQYREKEGTVAKQLSPSSQRHIEEFRRQVKILNAAENDEEVKRLLTQFLEEMGKAWHIPLLAVQPDDDEDGTVTKTLPLETSLGSGPSPGDFSSRL